jgi:catalase
MECADFYGTYHAFGHLKAIAVDKGGQVRLKAGNVGQDAGGFVRRGAG